jgi:hypothetical protein
VVPADPRAEYERRRARWAAAIARGDRRHLLVSNLRLAAVVLAALLAWLGFARAIVSPAWTLVPVAAFLALMVVHALVLNARDRAVNARDYYDRGFKRLDGSWMGSGPDGARFLDGHPYANDLDLFGAGSLFQLLDTARTEAGEEVLADFLGRTSSVAEIESRQHAVAELRDRLDFRESIAVVAADTPVSRTSALATWAASPPAGLGIPDAWIFAACAATTAILVVAFFVVPLPGGPVAAWLVVQSGIAAVRRRQVRQVLRGVDLAERDLSLLTELLRRIESETFTSPRLQMLHGRLVKDGVRLSRRIARLRVFIAARDSLRNEFVRPFALLLLVRSQSAVAIDRWHAAHRAQLAEWLTVVGELEALASLATYAFEHPANPFPIVTADGAVFAAAGLAHPLIHDTIGVRNDVSIGGEAPHVLIVSGSNMSGKSTLLRTVGANAVLAMAGAPVRAASLECSPLVIGATIHIEDSLQAGHSRFYAEILRIRDIVHATRGHTPVLFLLDEILHGTNSRDRRVGSEAIIGALVQAGAIGLVTTHDLALTELVSALGPRARNVHFEDRLEDGRMIFDYRMRDGVVEHSNALELMRAVGLKV